MVVGSGRRLSQPLQCLLSDTPLHIKEFMLHALPPAAGGRHGCSSAPHTRPRTLAAPWGQRRRAAARFRVRPASFSTRCMQLKTQLTAELRVLPQRATSLPPLAAMDCPCRHASEKDTRPRSAHWGRLPKRTGFKGSRTLNQHCTRGDSAHSVNLPTGITAVTATSLASAHRREGVQRAQEEVCRAAALSSGKRAETDTWGAFMCAAVQLAAAAGAHLRRVLETPPCSRGVTRL